MQPHPALGLDTAPPRLDFKKGGEGDTESGTGACLFFTGRGETPPGPPANGLVGSEIKPVWGVL